MIVQTATRAKEAGIGEVIVAVDDKDVYNIVREYGFLAVMTDKTHKTGSDRVLEAIRIVDRSERFEFIVNLQGDMPAISQSALRSVISPLADRDTDISTLAVEIDRAEAEYEDIVKIIGSKVSNTRINAIYFSRANIPWGDGPRYYHLGVYGYRRGSLERFASLERSILEESENLEQLRAIEAGMRISVEIVDDVPISVDTQEDLDKARHFLSRRKHDGRAIGWSESYI